jgi:hypothetical protein
LFTTKTCFNFLNISSTVKILQDLFPQQFLSPLDSFTQDFSNPALNTLVYSGLFSSQHVLWILEMFLLNQMPTSRLLTSNFSARALGAVSILQLGFHPFFVQPCMVTVSLPRTYARDGYFSALDFQVNSLNFFLNKLFKNIIVVCIILCSGKPYPLLLA